MDGDVLWDDEKAAIVRKKKWHGQTNNSMKDRCRDATKTLVK